MHATNVPPIRRRPPENLRDGAPALNPPGRGLPQRDPAAPVAEAG